MLLTDFDRSKEALDVLQRIVRRDPLRVQCPKCHKSFIRTDISPQLCPYGCDQ